MSYKLSKSDGISQSSGTLWLRAIWCATWRQQSVYRGTLKADVL